MKHPHDCRWGTKSEIEHIDRAGKCRKFPKPDPEARLRCLLGYRESVYLRTDWSGIDRDKIISYLNKTLALEYDVPPLPLLEEDHPAILIYRVIKKCPNISILSALRAIQRV